MQCLELSQPQTSVPRGDFQQSDHLYHRHQQHQQQLNQHEQTRAMSVHSDLITVLVRHRRLTEQLTGRLAHTVQILLQMVVAELSRVTAASNAPSSSLMIIFGLLKILNGKVNSVNLHYRVEYLMAYDVIVANARINRNFVLDNLHTVMLCSERVDALTLQLHRYMRVFFSGAAAAAAVWYLNEFGRHVSLFKQALVSYTCNAFNDQLGPTMSSTLDCCQTRPMPLQSRTERTWSSSSLASMSELVRCCQNDEELTSSLEKAFCDDVDQLLAQQLQQQPVIIAPSTYHDTFASSSTVDVYLSADTTRPLDSMIGMTPDPLTLSTTQQQMNVDATYSQPPEVKFSHWLRSRQTDLDHIVIDDEDAGLQPLVDYDSGLAQLCRTDLVDNDDTQVIHYLYTFMLIYIFSCVRYLHFLLSS